MRLILKELIFFKKLINYGSRYYFDDTYDKIEKIYGNDDRELVLW